MELITKEEWGEFLNENAENMAPQTLCNLERFLSKKELISLNSIPIDEDENTFEKVMNNGKKNS